MIVDCHTHIRSLDEAEISEHLAAAETVDACVVLAPPEGSRGEINKKLGEYVSRHADRMVGFGVVDPTEDRIDDRGLAELTETLGFKGFALYCSMCGFHPTHSRAMRFYEVVQRMGMPIFFHNGSHSLTASAVLEYTQPYLLDEVARAFPELTIIIGNMGVPFVEQTLSMVGKHERVFADLTIRPSKVWQTYNIVVAAHERGVMGKLLFGSGFPLSNAGDCIETLLGFNMLLSDTKLPTVPRGSIRNVIERNSLELLGIEHEQIRPPERKPQTSLPARQSE
ncbi:amidohydrolase family protein [Anaerobaca lacustris]|uniref:Amidohydrolase family protein n=1 Tax=Anaerobaca lacustris TaxID=3044600 RepID=A0AAW6U6B2_9BACT|nr:amidohydrolase family protein [Sedimentisphaerales bacterium M17dextr]